MDAVIGSRWPGPPVRKKPRILGCRVKCCRLVAGTTGGLYLPFPIVCGTYADSADAATRGVPE